MLIRQIQMLFLSFSLLLGIYAGAQAQNCGTAIIGEVTLTTDLLCPTGHGLLVKSGATLDCNRHTVRGGDRIGQYGIYLRNVNNATVRNCTVQNFEIGIRLSGATSSTVQNNVSQLNRRYGIEMTQSSTAILLQGNTVAGNSDEGIHISGPTTKDAVHHIVGNTLSGNSLEGIYFLNSSANTVTGNTVENHGAAGIYLKNSHRNAVQENTLINNPFQLVSGSQGNILTNNTIIGDRIKFDEASDNFVRAHSVQELGGRPSTAYDLNKASRNTIEDSVAIDPVDYHIRVANSSQDNVFTRFSTTPQTLQCYVDATSSVTVTNPSGQILQCSNSE